MTDVKTLWRNQKTEESVTLENIHDKAATFQKRIVWGNAIEYVAAVFVVLSFGWYVWVLPGWMTKLGSALEIFAAAFVVWQLHRRGKAAKLPGGTGVDLLDFHRSELVRRRDLIRSAWLWYILPFLPGMALMMLGRWFQAHTPGRSLAWDHQMIILGSAIAVLILVIVRLVQVIGAAWLQRKIDELDKLR